MAERIPLALPGRLRIDSGGRLRGAASITYNDPFPPQYADGRLFNGHREPESPDRGVLMHTMVCDLPDCIRIFNNPVKQASAHFGIAQDGRIHQFGPVSGGWIAWHAGGGNSHWYGIEHADHGNPDNPLTDAQLAASAQVVEALSALRGFPLQVTDSPSGRGYGTHVMGGVAWSPDRHTCPDSSMPGLPGPHARSKQRAAIIALAGQIRTPPPVPAPEDDMPSAIELPATPGETRTVSWPGGTAAGITLITDRSGPVIFALAEFHTTKGQWYPKDDITVGGAQGGRYRHKFANPDDCTAVQLTLKSGTGSTSLHT